MYPDNNIFSYLKWRGDIHLTQAPFNDIDALVLAIFSSLNLPGIVSDDGSTITVEAAAKKYFSADYYRNDHSYYQKLFKLMARAERFKDAKLSYYVNTLTDQTQFSAIKIQLSNGINFISFRGTDDSLVGWKEDFEISFKTTIAQKQAASYLTKVMGKDSEDYRLGGHSKGGNLAEYAALNVSPSLQKRITDIYTFDSPGLAQEVENQLPDEYLRSTLHRFVPEFSIIGRLFEPEDIPPTIVDRSYFVTRKHRNPQAKVYNQIINQWIGNATLQERESLTNDLFNSLAASGATKINELGKNGVGGFGAILISLTNSSRRTRFVFGSLIASFWQMIKDLEITKILFTPDSIVGWVLVILGIISLTAPQYAIRAFGAIVAFAGIGFSVKQILETANSALYKKQKQFFIISYLLIFALSIALLSNNRLLIFLAHYFLGIFLIVYSYVRLRQIILHKVPGIFKKIIICIEAVVAFALGIVVVVNPKYFNKQSIIIVGILLIIYGFFKLVEELFSQRKKMPTHHR